MTDISTWITNGREAEDLSAAELAEEADLDADDIEKWESGDATPSVAAIQAMSDVIGKPGSVKSTSKKSKSESSSNGGRDIDFERKLFKAADKLRNNMDAAEYKHVVLGLIFLKYISDAFEELHEELEGEPYADAEDLDEYRAKNVFWVPPQARWSYLQANARQPNIGKLIDEAMQAIESENTTLTGVLPKRYNRPALDKHTLGELIDLIGTIGLGGERNRSRDILGRVYEYFLGEFASAEGKKGGQFYTPRSVVRTLVEMLAPYGGRVYDPCCGSGGMFVQSEKFIEDHGGSRKDISVYGQESNPTTWRLAKMNLAIRGIDADLGGEHADSFHNDLHPDLKADYVIANPPFNAGEWGAGRLEGDPRWKYGKPPTNNANYAWIQHFLYHLAPSGIAGFVMANGSMSTQTSGEGEIRRNLVENDLVDCIVALPGQLFYSTQIPVCLWFLTKNKDNGKYRDRTGEVLFIDARKMGEMISRTQRTLTDDDVDKVANTYHAWRGDKELATDLDYEDVKGFCKAASLEEIAEHNHVLTPGRYVGIEDVDVEDDEPFEVKMERLTEALAGQFDEAASLNDEIRKNLGELGYEI
jgi:type I restriction enzyme M protein